MACYAAHNTRANLRNGNHGFANTWELSRFDTKAERDSFIEAYSNQLAKAVTRKEAERIFRAQYWCIGEPVPAGGLFGTDRYENSRF